MKNQDAIRRQIDLALKELVGVLEQEFRQSSSEEAVEEVFRAVFSGGKRLRPLLCYFAFLAADGKHGPQIIKAAASLELLHTFAIIHDDIMDESRTRRGRPSAYLNKSSSAGSARTGQFPLNGVSMAILAGDLALVASDRLFSESGFTPQQLANAWPPLNRMRMDAVAGQYLDLRHSRAASFDADLAIRIARLKSGSYSVQGPLLVGAALAGATSNQQSCLSNFGAALGEAFQLADDLAGLFGDASVTGKDAEADISQGKPTFLIASALRLADESQRQKIIELWGHPNISGDSLGQIRQVVAETGALQHTIQRIRSLVAQARAELQGTAGTELCPEPRMALVELADQIEAAVETASASKAPGAKKMPQ